MKTKARVWCANKFEAAKDAQVFVDTNIWLFMQMEEVTQNFAGNRAAGEYMEVIGSLLDRGATLRWSCFSYPEIAHVIERYYYKIYESSLASGCNKKNYRHEMMYERLKVVRKIQEVWDAIVATGVPVADYVVGSNMISDLVVDCRNYAVDAYDLFMISSLKNEGINYVLTDDKDFLTIPGIDVITLSRSALDLAEKNGVLQG